MLFKDLNIIEPIQKALTEQEYKETTPIQEQSIPVLLEKKDFIGCAQTGTGKTAAFAIPILQNIYNEKAADNNSKSIKALLLVPTRELAIQLGENFTAYGKYTGITNLVIFGGVSQTHQVRALKRGVDILIATPGRMLDLYNQKYINLHDVKYFVLDEADRMFDMGMIHDVKKIISKLPKVRQTMLFSATMPPKISALLNSIVKNPVKVEVTPASSTVDTIMQELYFVRKKEKKSLLKHLLKDKSIKSVLVFTRTKHRANMLTTDLLKAGISAAAIHGNKSQSARERALSNFKDGTIRVLVATDIAARGIDINELSHVVNFDLPEVPETYVHRIGRTGRAGFKGIAISFCDEEETGYLKSIEKLINKEINLITDHPYEMKLNTAQETNKKAASKRPSAKNKKFADKRTGKNTFSKTGKKNNNYNFNRRKNKSK